MARRSCPLNPTAPATPSTGASDADWDALARQTPGVLAFLCAVSAGDAERLFWGPDGPPGAAGGDHAR